MREKILRSDWWLGTVLILLLPGAAEAQAAPAASPQGAPTQQPPTIVVRARSVIVPVTVKDSHGELVGDLTRDQFRILVDGVEQKIATFSSDPVPLSAVVLLDNDLSQKVTPHVQKSLTTISAAFGPADEVALVTFDQFPETVSEFSFNNDLLFTKLKRLELGTHSDQVVADPTTAGPLINGQAPPSSTGIAVHGSDRYKKQNALNDAVYAAGQMLQSRGRDRRKIVFVVSDGNNAGRNNHTFEQTLRLLLDSDISVYSISVVHTVPVGKSLLQHGESELDKFATNTGGDTFYSSKEEELERLYSSLTEQARNEYTLTFAPDDVPQGRDYHEIEVRVRRPDLAIETRHGYYESAVVAGH
ncbi:MAG TPA: VWA domain-containing protein [Candidatus Acidoferrales bacterium]|nr:VWA domain-containing protein [Candidatus Acidoferrales bacterium]